MSTVGCMNRFSLKSLGTFFTLISVINEFMYVFFGASVLLLLSKSTCRASNISSFVLFAPDDGLGDTSTLGSGVSVVSLSRTIVMSRAVEVSPDLVSICNQGVGFRMYIWEIE